jgi:hypothetical protein
MARGQEENIRKCSGEVKVKELKGDKGDGEPWTSFCGTYSGVYNIKVCEHRFLRNIPLTPFQ